MRTSGHLTSRLNLVSLYAVLGSIGVGAYYLVPRGSAGAHGAYEVIACSGVAAWIASIDQVRNGPPDAVRIARLTSARLPAPNA